MKIANRATAIWLTVFTLSWWSVSDAASGFIASTHIESGSVYTELSIRFNCDVHYVGHEPAGKSDMLRIQLEPTSICHGVPPMVADGREMHRPLSADEAGLLHIEYDGQTPGEKSLRLGFATPVTVLISAGVVSDTLTIRIINASEPATVADEPDRPEPGRQISRPSAPSTRYVINLESSQRYPAPSEIPVMTLQKDQKLFISEALIDGTTWYRMRVGFFASAEAASKVLREVRAQYPTAWIDRESVATEYAETPTAAVAAVTVQETMETQADILAVSGETADLMAAAKKAMTAGELSKAIQIYTKVLQQPPGEFQQDAQEYLALARERNGQIAHAKAEYERYLARYPDGEGATRVSQRLAALLTSASTARSDTRVAANGPASSQASSPWKVRTFFAQHYRRDVNQLNEQEEITSQSSLYSDVTIDARRRGERFDFSTRVTAGHRYDLLDEEQVSSGNDVRVSYLYADLLDTRTRVRGRLGRQTRNTGGVLGRFDGINLTYSLSERARFEAVAGEPVYSTSQSDTQSRQFYGLSSNFTPFGQNLEMGVFYLQQQIDSLTDRQAIGTELRYFGETKSLWGAVHYDTAFSELSNAFLQGSWRLPGKLTLSGSVDRRRSPFLSLGNALLGQSNQDFDLLTQTMSEDEIRHIALDRSAMTSSASLGVSRPLTPRLQFSLNANLSVIDAVPENGDAPAMPETEYNYYSADLVASSLFKEGDVGILSLRYSSSDSADVYTISLDSRFPFGNAWRINPRLRVDYREITSDLSTQMIYTPGLRVQYRLGRRGRIQFEAGKRFSSREMADSDIDQESYFINLGYQLFY